MSEEPKPSVGGENRARLDQNLINRISALRQEFAEYISEACIRHDELSVVVERPPAQYDSLLNVANQRLAAYNKHISALESFSRKPKTGPNLDNLAADVTQLENYWKAAKLSSRIIAFQKLFFWDRSTMLQYKTRGGLSHFGKWGE